MWCGAMLTGTILITHYTATTTVCCEHRFCGFKRKMTGKRYSISCELRLMRIHHVQIDDIRRWRGTVRMCVCVCVSVNVKREFFFLIDWVSIEEVWCDRYLNDMARSNRTKKNFFSSKFFLRSGLYCQGRTWLVYGIPFNVIAFSISAPNRETQNSLNTIKSTGHRQYASHKTFSKYIHLIIQVSVQFLPCAF